MQAVIIYKPVNCGREHKDNIGGIYENISYNDLINEYEIPENNILLYIPLTISGRNYKERQADLENKAIEWSNGLGEYPNWSYGELADIQDFFETNSRRYGLIKTFKAESII